MYQPLLAVKPVPQLFQFLAPPCPDLSDLVLKLTVLSLEFGYLKDQVFEGLEGEQEAIVGGLLFNLLLKSLLGLCLKNLLLFLVGGCGLPI